MMFVSVPASKIFALLFRLVIARLEVGGIDDRGRDAAPDAVVDAVGEHACLARRRLDRRRRCPTSAALMASHRTAEPRAVAPPRASASA
jgi:hypothetical protein